MISRRISALCLSMATVLGLFGAWSANASALGEKFHSELEHTVLTGANYETNGAGEEVISEGEHSFTAGPFSVKCSTTTVSGTWSEKTPETMTMHPTYKNCKDNFGAAATIQTTGCNLVFWSEVLGGSDAKVEVECEAGHTINISEPGCTVSIAPQSSPGATYTTGGVMGSEDITVKSTFEAKFTKVGGFCVTEATKGKYVGSWTVRGYNDKCNAGECPFAPGGEGDKDAYKDENVVGIWWK
jgi:hypothetical protein